MPNRFPNSDVSLNKIPRIALIGCGAIAEGYYLPALAQHLRVLECLTLVDQNIDRARKLAAAFHIERCVADYHEVLGKVDGVILALPTHLHHPVAMEFLSRGVPVFCEKPLAESADKAREMIELAQQTGVALAANYQQRLLPNFAKVKDLMVDRTLGQPISIRYQVGEVFDWPTVSGFYFNAPIYGRGVLRDRGAHILDHICWWLGTKPRVLCSQNDSFGGSEAVAYVKFEHQNCVGEMRLSWLSKLPCQFIVEFEHGSIESEIYYPQSVLLKTGASRQRRVELKSETYSSIGPKMIDNFISVILNNEKPLVPGSEVIDSISMIDECYTGATRFEMPWYEIPEVINGKQ